MATSEGSGNGVNVVSAKDTPWATGRRRSGVSAQPISAEMRAQWKAPFHDKPEATISMIRGIISHNQKLQVLFGHLPEESIKSVIMAMFPREVTVGDIVIKQGDEGDNFWLVDHGSFDIFVKRDVANSVQETGDNSVDSEHGQLVQQQEDGGCFGELALMYNAPRAATVVCTKAGLLWGLDRQTFKMMLVTSTSIQEKQYEKFLHSSVKLFANNALNKYERGLVSDALDIDTFDVDEIIISEGTEVVVDSSAVVKGTDDGKMFIVEEGSAAAYTIENGEEKVLCEYGVGDYFGEIPALTIDFSAVENGEDVPTVTRACSVKALKEGCSVYWLSAADAYKLLGPVRQKMINVARGYSYKPLTEVAQGPVVTSPKSMRSAVAPS